ncbi:serine carboxypeptidase-like [Dorcoceras hygrometricum]|uniref:Serine carboxypeptidase-like n=1 Tax=Dorcoceras hygrometricum TaxID=472368 RepID=A0A2Z7CJC4_9LAMI|nr:serine carboxypeptidase-like [Dorcoceras hygrometricum]
MSLTWVIMLAITEYSIPNMQGMLLLDTFIAWKDGNSKWLDAMEWSGQEKYIAASTVPFLVDGEEAGLQKGHGPLTFLRVHNAGHMVPMDHPKHSLEMIKRWMQGGSPLNQAGSFTISDDMPLNRLKPVVKGEPTRLAYAKLGKREESMR